MVGLPDASWGEVVCAAIVVRPGATLPTVAELRAHVASTLVGPKQPRVGRAGRHAPPHRRHRADPPPPGARHDRRRRPRDERRTRQLTAGGAELVAELTLPEVEATVLLVADRVEVQVVVPGSAAGADGRAPDAGVAVVDIQVRPDGDGSEIAIEETPTDGRSRDSRGRSPNRAQPPERVVALAAPTPGRAPVVTRARNHAASLTAAPWKSLLK